MATDTTTKRQAAGEKAAATRKRNAANRSASRTRASASRTRTSARGTASSAQTTASQASRTAQRRAQAAGNSLEALVLEAQRRLVHIPVGAALEARDAAVKSVRPYLTRQTARVQLDRFERRGERALRRR